MTFAENVLNYALKFKIKSVKIVYCAKTTFLKTGLIPTVYNLNLLEIVVLLHHLAKISLLLPKRNSKCLER